MDPFEAKVSAWVAKSKAMVLAVRNQSAQDVIELAQLPVAKGGNLPIVTGFLRASGQATRDGSLPSQQMRPGKAEPNSFTYDAGPVSLVIASAKITDTITFAYTANYAKYVEARRKFVALAAQQWQRIVRENCALVKSRYG